MISQSRARTLSLPILAIAGVAAFCLTETRAKADQWDKKTILTIDQPVQVRNTYLPPGTYVFKLLDSQSDRHVVQIFNSDQSRIIDTVMAIPNYRLQPTGTSRFAFWETPPGKAKAMRAWFYPGDNFGQEFPLSKKLRDVEVAQVITRTDTTTASNYVEETPTATASPAPAATDSNNDANTAAATTAVAESNEPTASPSAPVNDPMPEAAEPAPAPATAAEPSAEAPSQNSSSTQSSSELPKTASPYPMAGMLGLLSIGSWAALRRKRAA